MSKVKKEIQDPDLVGVEAALQRAAAKARKIAEETHTPLIVYENGRVVKKYSWKKKSKQGGVKVKQFITDTRGQKVAAIINMDELKRLETVLDLVPFPEKWLYKNKKALESVQKGLKQAARGKISKLDLNGF